MYMPPISCLALVSVRRLDCNKKPVEEIKSEERYEIHLCAREVVRAHTHTSHRPACGWAVKNLFSCFILKIHLVYFIRCKSFKALTSV